MPTPPATLHLDPRRRPCLTTLQVKVDNFVHLKILRVDLGPEFPEYAPQLTLCETLSDWSRPLDRQNTLYSPRWDPERVATALYAHAVDALSKLA